MQEKIKLKCPKCKNVVSVLWNLNFEYACDSKQRKICKQCRDNLLKNIAEYENKDIKDKSVAEKITCPGCGAGENCPCVLHSISSVKGLEEKKLKSYPKDIVAFSKKDFDKFKKTLVGM